MKRSWRNFKYYPDICLEVLRKATETSVRIADLGPRFELGTSKLRSWSANHSTTTFGEKESKTQKNEIGNDEKWKKIRCKQFENMKSVVPRSSV
jgi:hypothetical protein